MFPNFPGSRARQRFTQDRNVARDWGMSQLGNWTLQYLAVTDTTAALTVNRAYWSPVWIKQPFSSVLLGFSLSAIFAGSASVDMALYDNLNGMPRKKLCQQTGMNSGTGGATGTNSTALLRVPRQRSGLFWIALGVNANTATFNCLSGSNTQPGVNEASGRASVAPANPIQNAWRLDGLGLGALPADATGLMTAHTNGSPVVGAQVS